VAETGYDNDHDVLNHVVTDGSTRAVTPLSCVIWKFGFAL
jgi:hypothetical protein